MTESRIMLFTEGGARPDLVETLSLILPVTPHNLFGCSETDDAALARPAPVQVAAVVAEVGLADIEVARALRRALARHRPPGSPFVCLLQDPDPEETRRAQALGPDMILDASLAPEHLIDVLLPIARSASGDENVPLREAVSRVAGTVAGLFQSARRDGRVDTRSVKHATGIMRDAIEADGMEAWLRVVQLVDEGTYRHCLIVAGIMTGFTMALGLERQEAELLSRAALLHDVGKACIPPEILGKPDGLTPEELQIMQRHVVLGHELLVAGDTGEVEPLVLTLVRSHHEYLDGSGYPDGLSGDEIPDAVRIMTLCDIFGALIERRPYKPPMPPAEAFALMEWMGGRLDRDLLRALRASYQMLAD